MRSTHATWDAAVAAAHAAANASGLPHAVLVVRRSWFAVTRADHIPPGMFELVAGVISPKEGS